MIDIILIAIVYFSIAAGAVWLYTKYLPFLSSSFLPILCCLWPIFIPSTILCWCSVLNDYLMDKRYSFSDLNEYQQADILKNILETKAALPNLMGINRNLDKLISNEFKK